MPFPYVFTFYSYKGGVGRSLAVMNVAYTLAGRGRHVLVVDMDLEAPGLSGFLHRKKELSEPADAHPKDVLTLLAEAVRAVKGGGPSKDLAANLPALSNYIRTVPAEKLAPLRPKLGELGRLDVLCADVQRDYLGRLAQLGLKDLTHDQLIQLSSLLNFYFKAQTFPDRPLWMEEFEPSIETPYDYVLVDSRTGITDIGGLCVGPLADRLVVITGLNDQNIEGTLVFLEETGIKPEARSPGAKWDDADPAQLGNGDNASLGPKPTILVASPVPDSEITLQRERLAELEERLGIKPISLSYHPLMALMEKIVVRDYRELTLAAQYDRLATRVMVQVGDDPQSLMKLSHELFNKEKSPEAALPAALRVASHVPELGMPMLLQLFHLTAKTAPEYSEFKVVSHTAELGMMTLQIIPRTGSDSHPQANVRPLHAALIQSGMTESAVWNNWGLALTELAKASSTDADRFFEASCREFATAAQLEPESPTAFDNWGTALVSLARTKEARIANSFFDQADAKFAEAIRLEPDAPATLNNWGVALSSRARMTTGPDTEQLLVEARSKFVEALRLKPEFPEALNNFGALLMTRAGTRTGNDRVDCLAEANLKFTDAIGFNPGYFEAWYNWASALAELAQEKPGLDADRLYKEANSKYAEAIRLRPSYFEALNRWGVMLAHQAKTTEGPEAGRLFQEAGRKFAEALVLKPNLHEALHNWGMVLARHARVESGLTADRLRTEAGEKFAEALRLRPGLPPTLENWGVVLSEQAMGRSGLEADRLFAAAGEKFSELHRLQPEDHHPLIPHSAVLINQAATKSGEEARRLFALASEKCMAAEELSKGSGAFNLACIESHRGNATEAIRWLQASIAAGNRHSKAEIAAEKDFDQIRDRPEFIVWLDSIPSN